MIGRQDRRPSVTIFRGSGVVDGMVGDEGVGVAGWQAVEGGVDGVCIADGLAVTGRWLIVSLPGRCGCVD